MNGEKESLDSIKQLNRKTLTSICGRLEATIVRTLKEAGVYHQVLSRVKTENSIYRKMKWGNYGGEKRIQDIIGIRIILYFQDDIRICEEIMTDLFGPAAWAKSHNGVDEFKPSKRNGVFRLPGEYAEDLNKHFDTYYFDKTFELQFRTINFEGWHEIEHDMRYKNRHSDMYEVFGYREASRMLNGIIAAYEVHDWTMVKIFDDLAYKHYDDKHWEAMLASKCRLRLVEDNRLDERLIPYMSEIANDILECPRLELVRALIPEVRRHNYKIDLNLLVYVYNCKVASVKECLAITRLFHSDSSLLKSTEKIQAEMEPLKKRTVYSEQIEIDKNSYDLMAVADIIFEWSRKKFGSVFSHFYEEYTSAQAVAQAASHHILRERMGYRLYLSINEKKDSLQFSCYYADMDNPASFWQVDASMRNYVLASEVYYWSPNSEAGECERMEPEFMKKF